MERSLYKGTKMGHVPGDLPISSKIRMLEDRDTFTLPWGQVIGSRCISAFRREFFQKAKKRVRAHKVKESDK